MKTTMLLCDYAQEVAGKLYVLGGGWSIYRGTPVTMGLAVKIAVPWDGANMPHEFAARLVTEDGGDPVLPPAGGGGGAGGAAGRGRRGADPHRIQRPVRDGAAPGPAARQRSRRTVRRQHRRPPAASGPAPGGGGAR